MTLDEAIKHAEEVAEQKEMQADKWQEEGGEKWGKTTTCRERAEWHRQLVEWLKDYKRLKEQELCEDAISRRAVLDEAFEVDTKEYGRIEVVGVDAIAALSSVTLQ